jgi:hypothetical protein
VYSTFIFIESHKPRRIRQAKRESPEEDHELPQRAGFCNNMIFCAQCLWNAPFLRRFSRRSNAANARR